MVVADAPLIIVAVTITVPGADVLKALPTNVAPVEPALCIDHVIDWFVALVGTIAPVKLTDAPATAVVCTPVISVTAICVAVGVAVWVAYGPAPIAFNARTLNEYGVPLVKLVMVATVIRPGDSCHAPSLIEISKPVMALPPSLAGTAQLSITWVLPAVAVKLSGTVGAVVGATGIAVAIASTPAPIPFTARTLKLYVVPLVNPVKVCPVLLDANIQDVPLSCET